MNGVAAGALAAAVLACAWSGTALAQADRATLNERLFAAVRSNDMATVRSVLTQGADPMARDSTGQTAAGLAVDHGYFEVAHYILSVRNQQQTLRQRDADAVASGDPVAPALAPAPANQSVREPPTPSWRGAAVAPGQATEIPSARLTPPREAVTITPAQPKAKSAPAAKSPSAAKPAPAAKSAPSAVPAPASQPPQLSNLPRLPRGAPNPFDPRNSATPALPVITATGTQQPAAAAPTTSPGVLQVAPPEATPAPEPEPRRPPNPFGRIWNNLTDWFSLLDPRPRGIEVAQASVGASDVPLEPLVVEVPALGQFFSRVAAAFRSEPLEAPAPSPTVERAALATQPTRTELEPDRTAGDEPGFFARLFSSIRIEPSQGLVEPLPAPPPRTEPRDARSVSASIEAKPVAIEIAAIGRFFSSLIRRDVPDDVPQFETAAVAVPEVRLPDEALPLPIIADPAFAAPTATVVARPEPKMESVEAPPAPPRTAGQIIAAEEAVHRPSWFGTLLRNLWPTTAHDPAAAEEPPPQVAALAAPAAPALRVRSESAPAARPVPLPKPAAPVGGRLAVEDFSLERQLADQSARERNCFQKGRQPGWYCIESADWPDEIVARMEVDSWLFSRGRMIVHYDNSGRALSLLTLFPSEHFNAIVRFLEARLGPATSDANRKMPVIGAPAKLNLITTWSRRESEGARANVLEVRKFDTVRSMIPDQQHGILTLMRDGATPIFRYVSEADLMMLGMKIESAAAAEREAARAAGKPSAKR